MYKENKYTPVYLQIHAQNLPKTIKMTIKTI